GGAGGGGGPGGRVTASGTPGRLTHGSRPRQVTNVIWTSGPGQASDISDNVTLLPHPRGRGPMLTRFARLATSRTRAVLIAAVLFVVVAGALGGGVAKNLTAGGFEDPSTQSARADKALSERFHTGIPTVVLVVTARSGRRRPPPRPRRRPGAPRQAGAPAPRPRRRVLLVREQGPAAAQRRQPPGAGHRPHHRLRRPGRQAHRRPDAHAGGGRRRR